jgi:hypothetical protein
VLNLLFRNGFTLIPCKFVHSSYLTEAPHFVQKLPPSFEPNIHNIIMPKDGKFRLGLCLSTPKACHKVQWVSYMIVSCERLFALVATSLY